MSLKTFLFWDCCCVCRPPTAHEHLGRRWGGVRNSCPICQNSSLKTSCIDLPYLAACTVSNAGSMWSGGHRGILMGRKKEKMGREKYADVAFWTESLVSAIYFNELGKSPERAHMIWTCFWNWGRDKQAQTSNSHWFHSLFEIPPLKQSTPPRHSKPLPNIP